jgi:hypothetical protein
MERQGSIKTVDSLKHDLGDSEAAAGEIDRGYRNYRGRQHADEPIAGSE